MCGRFSIVTCALLVWTFFDGTTGHAAFNQSMYKSSVSSFYSMPGDYLVTVGVQYNGDAVIGIEVNSYVALGEYRAMVSIGSNGKVELSQAIRQTGTILVNLSAFVEIELLNGETAFENINAQLEIIAEGLMVVRPDVVHINISQTLPVQRFTYNLSQHVVPSVDAVIKHVLIFKSEPSEVLVSTYSGILTLLHGVGLDIGTYSVDVRCSYDVTLDNGSFVVDLLTFTVRVSIIGCKGGTKGLLEWPDLSPCERAVQSCSQLLPILSGGEIVQHCSHEGDWTLLDMSQCYLCRQDVIQSPSFAVVWLHLKTESVVLKDTVMEGIEQWMIEVNQDGLITNVSYVPEASYGSRAVILLHFAQVINSSYIIILQNQLMSIFTLQGLLLESEDQPTGLMVFVPTQGCPQYRYATSDATTPVHICARRTPSDCRCTNTSSDTETVRDSQNPDCSDGMLTTTTSGLPRPDFSEDGSVLFHFSQTLYKRTPLYLSDVNIGDRMLTVELNVTGLHLVPSLSVYYDIHGYGARLFGIGHSTGAVKFVRSAQYMAGTYNFVATAYFVAHFTNGSIVHSSAAAGVEITFENDVDFQKALYELAVNSDVPVHTELLNLNTLVTVKPDTFDELQLQFAVMEYSNYPSTDSPTPANPLELSSLGSLTKIGKMLPKHEYILVVGLTAEGLNVKGKQTTSTATMNVKIQVRGCPLVEDGAVVWPSVHPCGVATLPCSEYDSESFISQGVVTRKCSNEGVWTALDFRLCALKRGSKPFVMLWMSFYIPSHNIWSTDVIFFILRDIRRVMAGLPLESIDVHGIKTLSRPENDGVTIRFKAHLYNQPQADSRLLAQLLASIEEPRSLGGLLLFKFHGSSGVTVFKPTDYCPSEILSSSISFEHLVCREDENVSCRCGELVTSENKNVTKLNSTCSLMGESDNTKPGSKISHFKDSNDSHLKCSTDVGSEHVYLQWTLDSNLQAQVDHFVVTYILAGGFIGDVIIEPSQTSVNLTGLLPGGTYQVVVSGAVGRGSSSSGLTCSHTIVTQKDEQVAPFQLLLTTDVDVCGSQSIQQNQQLLLMMAFELFAETCKCNVSAIHFGQVFSSCQIYDGEGVIFLASWIYNVSSIMSGLFTSLLKGQSDIPITFSLNSDEYTVNSVCNSDFTDLVFTPCRLKHHKSLTEADNALTGVSSNVLVSTVVILFTVLCVAFIAVTIINAGLIWHWRKFTKKNMLSTEIPAQSIEGYLEPIKEEDPVLEHEF